MIIKYELIVIYEWVNRIEIRMNQREGMTFDKNRLSMIKRQTNKPTLPSAQGKWHFYLLIWQIYIKNFKNEINLKKN